MDIIRVLRIVEYVGPRDLVEAQVARSIHGTREFGTREFRSVRISAATIGTFPEILKQEPPAVVVPKGTVVIGNGKEANA